VDLLLFGLSFSTVSVDLFVFLFDFSTVFAVFLFLDVSNSFSINPFNSPFSNKTLVFPISSSSSFVIFLFIFSISFLISLIGI